MSCDCVNNYFIQLDPNDDTCNRRAWILGETVGYIGYFRRANQFSARHLIFSLVFTRVIQILKIRTDR